MTASTTDWFRRYQLIVGAQGSGLSIDNLSQAGLRLQFEITKSLMKEPNQAKITIFNLNDDHVSQIEDEYTDVVFSAGYDGNVKLIYSGNTQYVSHYRDGLDMLTELVCGDGDRGFRNAYVNKTFASGSTDAQVVDYCAKQLGVRKGATQLPDTGFLRGRTYSGMAHETLDEIAQTNGCNWSIQDGVLQMVRTDSMLDQETAVVLSVDTGLLEAAERTDKGIKAKCLLNASISVNSAIKLDNSALKVQANQKRNITKSARGPVVDTNKDGIYKVFKVRHMGDTHDNDWITEVLCVGLGQPVPTNATNKNNAVPIEGLE